MSLINFKNKNKENLDVNFEIYIYIWFQVNPTQNRGAFWIYVGSESKKFRISI